MYKLILILSYLNYKLFILEDKNIYIYIYIMYYNIKIREI
jgi:hypothetical protein